MVKIDSGMFKMCLITQNKINIKFYISKCNFHMMKIDIE